MTRLIVTVCLLFLISNALAQNPNSSVLVKKFDLNLLLLKKKLVTDSLVNVYGDISDPELIKILNDTAFIKSVIEPNSHAHDRLICSTLRIPFILKPLGWASDYGHIFTDSQIEILDF